MSLSTSGDTDDILVSKENLHRDKAEYLDQINCTVLVHELVDAVVDSILNHTMH